MEPSRGKAICLPCDDEVLYRTIVDQPADFRCWLWQAYLKHPELFPRAFEQGFSLHDSRFSKKQALRLRRIKIKATDDVFLVRPSFVLPYMTALADEVEKALFLRQWGVPFEALAYVFGRNPKFWERQWLALGRPSLVGTTIKDPNKLSRHLVADEKHTRLNGQKVFVATTVADGCILGANVVASASEPDLSEAYDEFAEEAQDLDPNYSPETICLDGWSATQNAWKTLFPNVVVILCFLHSVLKVAEACLKRFGNLRREVLDRAWQIYRADDKRAFSQRVRRLREWALNRLWQGKLQEAILKLCSKKDQFLLAFDHAKARRTSNMIDRLMSYQDRLLFAQRYFHGGRKTARLCARAQAALWNFHPYGRRLRQREPERRSPFEDVNGFSYHSNWLHNFLAASSLGGHRL